MNSIPYSRFVRNFNGISKKLASNDTEKIIVTRRGKPLVVVFSLQNYEEQETLIRQKLAELKK